MIYKVKTSFGNGNIQALAICKDIANLDIDSNEHLEFDFVPYGENNPFSNLVIINSLRRCRKENPNVSMSCNPKDEDGYLSHIGFYQAIGTRLGKRVGQAIPNSNYVPIRELDLYGQNPYLVIPKTAEQLAATLQFDPSLQSLLTYSFIETIRNVFEHSDVHKLLVSAQKWPSHQLVEIAVADAGCGIKNSLGKRFALNELDLLKLACKPGISALSNYAYLEDLDPWRNSGYGLYMIKELCLAYGGSFMICSGNYALRFFVNFFGEIGTGVYRTNYSGTALSLRFRTDSKTEFDKIRDGIVKRGEEEAKNIKGAIEKASLSSGGRYHFD